MTDRIIIFNPEVMIKSKKNEKDQCDSEPNNQGLQMRQFLLCSYTTSV